MIVYGPSLGANDNVGSKSVEFVMEDTIKKV